MNTQTTLLTNQRGILSVGLSIALVLVSCFSLSFYKACDKSERDQVLAYAQDIATAFRDAAPLITQLAPDFAAQFNKGVGIAQDLIVAIKASMADRILTLLRDLVPIAEQTFARFSGNKQVLIAFALADIGIHFLINHLSSATGNAAASSASGISDIGRYAAHRAWGCQYKPKKCGA